MTRDYQDLATIRSMEKHGGSFVIALAGAFRYADERNRERLKAAFPDYWDKYTKMASADEPKDALPGHE